jgi:DNA-binding HxlR family transcriptional regulator
MDSDSCFQGDRHDPSTDLPRFIDPEQAIRPSQEIVGRKWNPIILYHLSKDGPLGFSVLRNTIDNISSKMLSESLSDLQSAGIVSRRTVEDQPVRVQYSLTTRGETLEPVITEMVRWGIRQRETAVDESKTQDCERHTQPHKES